MIIQKAEVSSNEISAFFIASVIIEVSGIAMPETIKCVGHNAQPAGESPVTGIYRQV